VKVEEKTRALMQLNWTHVNKEPSTGYALAALRKRNARDPLAQHFTVDSNAALQQKSNTEIMKRSGQAFQTWV
jgi:hypothetical protein